MELPHEWRELDGEAKKLLEANLSHCDLVQYDTGLVMPRVFAETMADKVYSFEVREDDIWVVSFPKTGTTLMLEMLWMIINNMEDPADTPHMVRCPWLEATAFLSEGDGLDSPYSEIRDILQDSIQHVASIKGRRIIKTHLPLEFLPPHLADTCKVIYLGRNPADTAVSFYHWHKETFSGSFATFIDMFCKGLFGYGNYFHHLMSGWNMRDHPNVSFLWYEDVQHNLEGAIRNMSIFLDHGWPMYIKNQDTKRERKDTINQPLTDENVENMARLLSFENMKMNPMTNPLAGINSPMKHFYMRKGIVGDWRNHFDETMMGSWNGWIFRHIGGIGLKDLDLFRHTICLDTQTQWWNWADRLGEL